MQKEHHNHYLDIRQLSHMYHQGTGGEIRALRNIDLSLKKGEFVTIVGSNAAGKSTLFGIITGMIQPTSGTMSLDGTDLKNIPEHERAKNIARVAQNPSESVIGSLSIAENLALGKMLGASHTLARGVKRVWRDEFIELLRPFALGLESRLDTPVSLLSGGQKQTIALLAVSMQNPKLLLLDEHTAALDPRMSKTILEITNKLVRETGATTLMITHNINHAIDYGDRLIMLDRGRIAFAVSGEEKKLLNAKAIIEKIEYHALELEEDIDSMHTGTVV